METEKIRLLLEKQLREPLSLEEETELLRYVSEDEQQVLELMVRQISEQAQEPEIVAPEMIRSLYERAMYTDRKPARRGLRGTRSRTRWMVTGALLLLTAGVAYIYTTRAPQGPAVAVQDSRDIPPGRNGALLTLADGTVIPLDDAGNGQLAKQEGAVITKEGGTLKYGTGEGNAGNLFNTMSTPRGRQFQLVLPDGSKVWLNAASAIRYPVAFNNKERIVELEGEAYFEIAAQAQKPFVLKVHNNSITVLGTAFNVMAYEAEPVWRTTLVNGAVKVAQGQQQVVLKPGEQAQTRAGFTVETGADVEAEIAWKNGNFFFNDKTTVQSVMRQVCDWYDVEVAYHGTINKHIGGRVAREVSLLQMLRFIEETGAVKCKLEGKVVHIYPS